MTVGGSSLIAPVSAEVGWLPATSVVVVAAAVVLLPLSMGTPAKKKPSIRIRLAKA